mmetsp:Transcript_18614/g.21188  ORF Transcript_18614/g.21188 Transcript_18614/m.21188 type:complete len:144 (-) Transcript_18614:72-503(-)
MSSSSKDAFKHVIDSIYAAINDGNIEDALQISQETWLLKAISKHERFGATFREVSGLQRWSDDTKKWNALHHYWLYHKKKILKDINKAQLSPQSYLIQKQWCLASILPLSIIWLLKTSHNHRMRSNNIRLISSIIIMMKWSTS